jgi:hypothetical protein
MKGWHCHWVLISFGLAPDYKVVLHEEIFSLCYYSNGGFTQSEVYALPIYLRRFYLKKLVDVKKQESSQTTDAGKGQKGGVQKTDRVGINR